MMSNIQVAVRMHPVQYREADVKWLAWEVIQSVRNPSTIKSRANTHTMVSTHVYPQLITTAAYSEASAQSLFIYKLHP